MKKNKQYWAGDHLEDVIEPKMPLLPFPSILREEASPTEAPKEITGEYTHGELAYFLDVSMPTLTKWR